MENFIFNNMEMSYFIGFLLLGSIVLFLMYIIIKSLIKWEKKLKSQNKSLLPVHIAWNISFILLIIISILSPLSVQSNYLRLEGEINQDFFYKVKKSNQISLYKKEKIERIFKKNQITKDGITTLEENKTIFSSSKEILSVQCDLSYNECVDNLKINIQQLVDSQN